MSFKIFLFLFTIFMIGVIALPSTLSIFLGQHNWYYLDNPTSDVPCQKCHADIYEELNQSSYHTNWGVAKKADTKDCEACHRGNTSINYADSYQSQFGDKAHAASSINCGYCHFNTSNMHNVVHGNLSNYLNYTAPTCSLCHNAHGIDSYGIAGGFNLSNHPTDSGSNSTHFELVLSSEFYSNIYSGESESCILCHTAVKAKINFTSLSGYSITATNTISGSKSEWDVNISAGDYINYTEKVRE